MMTMTDTTDDILDMLDEPEEEMGGEEVKPDNVPPRNKGNENYKKQSNSLYDSTTIPPVKIETSNFKLNKKFFVIACNETRGVEIPDSLVTEITRVAKALFNKGYRCRAAYSTRDKVLMELLNTRAEYVDLYTPWTMKQLPAEYTVKQSKPTIVGYGIAVSHHKIFSNLASPIRANIAAEVHALLGSECDTPVAFIISYSDNGAEALTAPNGKDLS